MSGKTRWRQKNKISRKEELVVFFFFFQNVLYKVDRHQTKPQRRAEDPYGDGKEKPSGRGERGAQIKDHDERNYNRMTEVVCEGWRFGGRTNKNARDRLWVVLVAWAAKSDSFICLPWPWHRWHTPPPWHRSHWPVQKKQKGLQSITVHNSHFLLLPRPLAVNHMCQRYSLLNVTRHSPGSLRLPQTWPRFPCRCQCRAHAGPPWCRHCHPSGSCSCQRCSPTGEGPQNNRVRRHDRPKQKKGARGSNTCHKLFDKIWNISCCMIIKNSNFQPIWTYSTRTITL